MKRFNLLVASALVALVFLSPQKIGGMETPGKEEKRSVEMELAIPLVAQGYEKIYQRFLKSELIYRLQ